LPPVATITTSSTTSGELEMPQNGIFTCVSATALCDQITAPVTASSELRIPVAPSAYTRPSTTAGVPRGPAPPFDSQNRVASRCRHTVAPVLIR
jgi:hypothetical protein